MPVTVLASDGTGYDSDIIAAWCGPPTTRRRRPHGLLERAALRLAPGRPRLRLVEGRGPRRVRRQRRRGVNSYPAAAPASSASAPPTARTFSAREQQPRRQRVHRGPGGGHPHALSPGADTLSITARPRPPRMSPSGGTARRRTANSRTRTSPAACRHREPRSAKVPQRPAGPVRGHGRSAGACHAPRRRRPRDRSRRGALRAGGDLRRHGLALAYRHAHSHGRVGRPDQCLLEQRRACHDHRRWRSARLRRLRDLRPCRVDHRRDPGPPRGKLERHGLRPRSGLSWTMGRPGPTSRPPTSVRPATSCTRWRHVQARATTASATPTPGVTRGGPAS